MKPNAQTNDMRGRLTDFYMQNPNEHLGDALLRLIEDPLKARSEHGTFRINPILLFLAMVLALTLGTFLLFGFI
jgi:hypothetical protein